MVANLTIYLVFTTALCWLLNIDIYINFLVIIDLGLFLVLLTFIINLVSLFSFRFFKLTYNTPVLILVILLTGYIYSRSVYKSLPGILYTSYINFYKLFWINLSTDLQLISEAYFTYLPFEFILLNFILYISIFVFMITLSFNNHTSLLYPGPGHFQFYFRKQSVQEQLLQKSIVRVWEKNSLASNL